MEFSPTFITIIIGLGLDCILGDPYWMPHPIRVYGHAIAFLEKRLNLGSLRLFKGGLCWLLLLSSVLSFFLLIQLILEPYELILAVINGIFFYFALSNRCLIEEALKVERYLHQEAVTAARLQLSMIVGRDTLSLSPSQIRAATVETTAENLSDGVIAPLFFFLIGGIPLMMGYKLINTLDSMIGYKNDRYRDFGFVAAKLDDLANYVPARLTAFLMFLCSGTWRTLDFIFRYARCHSSPNAGYPEAALAGMLNCRLGGPSSYFGLRVDKPYIGDISRELTHADVIRSCWLNAKVFLLASSVLLALSYF